MFDDLPLQPRLPAGDLARAKAWYREKLGLEPTAEDPAGLWYQTGGQWFLVFQTPNAGTARNTAAGWTVPDLVATMTTLRERGVAFDDVDMGGGMKTVDGLLQIGPVKVAWFKDSEGNTIELSQVPPR
jgi:catechol 2,3-dioxygenase-like lactoylglutathione lyase family enzyme